MVCQLELLEIKMGEILVAIKKSERLEKKQTKENRGKVNWNKIGNIGIKF